MRCGEHIALPRIRLHPWQASGALPEHGPGRDSHGGDGQRQREGK